MPTKNRCLTFKMAKASWNDVVFFFFNLSGGLDDHNLNN